MTTPHSCAQLRDRPLRIGHLPAVGALRTGPNRAAALAELRPGSVAVNEDPPLVVAPSRRAIEHRQPHTALGAQGLTKGSKHLPVGPRIIMLASGKTETSRSQATAAEGALGGGATQGALLNTKLTIRVAPAHRGQQHRSGPERRDRRRLDPAAELEVALARVQDDAAEEAIAEPVSKPGQVLCSLRPGGGG